MLRVNRFLKVLGIVATIAAGLLSASAEKKVLDHTCFDDWKAVKNTGLSKSGEWAAYAVDPQEGDGILYFYNTKNGKEISIPRG